MLVLGTQCRRQSGMWASGIGHRHAPVADGDGRGDRWRWSAHGQRRKASGRSRDSTKCQCALALVVRAFGCPYMSAPRGWRWCYTGSSGPGGGRAPPWLELRLLQVQVGVCLNTILVMFHAAGRGRFPLSASEPGFDGSNFDRDSDGGSGYLLNKVRIK